MWIYRAGLSAALFTTAVMCAMSMVSHPPRNQDVTAQAKDFVQSFTAKLRPVEIEANRAWWIANITGEKEAFEKKVAADNRLNALLSEKQNFERVKHLKESGKITDPVTKRAIDVIYLMCLGKQVEPSLLEKMTALGNALEEKFSNFRAVVEGKKMTDAEVRRVLKTSKLSERRKDVYLASKEIGKLVEKDLRTLVGLRNQAAKELGFANFHAMQLYLNEQEGKQLLDLFDKLDELTREPFRKAKAEIDVKLAKNVGVSVENLMPWHYHDPFFQEVPSVFEVDLDEYYAKLDLLKLSRDFYAGIGLPIDLVIEKTGDFEPREGKNPHAFCTDITRDGTDVRVLANVVPNTYWMSTLLHEFGHAVYSSINIPETLPYVLRTESHILTTEGIAMMFERLSNRRAWLEAMDVKVADAKAFDETAEKMTRYKLLIFSRWCQVMLRFEKAMYENPDQDLNKLWWDLVEQYQMLKRPPDRDAPDYASKYHIIGAPVYYHNYMMGELFASQLHHAIARDLYNGANPAKVVYVGNKAVGKYVDEKVFDPGRLMSWNELTRHATGAELSASAFAKDLGG